MARTDQILEEAVINGGVPAVAVGALARFNIDSVVQRLWLDGFGV
jgi:hypothetical protein